jgi:rRNA maturation protein Nop10
MGWDMSKCRQCNIEIMDETQCCPLCGSVLEQTGDAENKYPNIKIKSKRFLFLSRIYLFLAVVTEIILINVCMWTQVQSIVYIITGIILLYVYIVLRYAIIGTSGYRAKTLVLTLLAVLMLIAIDILSGYKGWSVNYVFPSGIIFVDAAILVIMAVNYKNWQSYMMQQIFMILCSIVALILCKVGVITSPILSIIAMNVSLIIFLGTLILGGRRARVELLRRFHIS